MPEKFIIISKPQNPRARELASEIAQWLQEQDVACEITDIDHAEFTSGDMCIVLGGDGTILGAGRKLAGKGIPILGINFGRVGFLTSGESGNWQELLWAVLQSRLPAKKCTILRWELFRSGGLFKYGVAINDVLIARGVSARLISLNIRIDDYALSPLRCDGICICSPLGSSGYNSSAGGPMLFPSLPSFCITPVCPFLSCFKPLVLQASSQAIFEIPDNPANPRLTIDGQEAWDLLAADQVRITGWVGGLSFINRPENFFIKLDKMTNCQF